MPAQATVDQRLITLTDYVQRMELFIMAKIRNLQHEAELISVSFKAAVFVAIIGVLVSMFFAFGVQLPSVAFDEPVATMAETYLTADGPPPQPMFRPEGSAEAAKRTDVLARGVDSQ